MQLLFIELNFVLGWPIRYDESQRWKDKVDLCHYLSEVYNITGEDITQRIKQIYIYIYSQYSMNLGLVPGVGRYPAEGNSYPLQDSGLENSMDRGACLDTVQWVAKSRT